MHRSNHHLRTLAATAFCALALTACLGGSPKTPEAWEKSRGLRPTKAKVTLLEPGMEPLFTLSYDPSPGDQEVVELSEKQEVIISVAGRDVKTEITETITLAFGVTDRSDSKVLLGFQVLGYSEVWTVGPPDQVNADRLLRGRSGIVETDRRGRVKRVLLDRSGAVAASTAVDAIEVAVMSLFTPLPEEPVGKGARWTVTQRFWDSGIWVESNETYEFTGFDDDGNIRLRVTGSAKGFPGKMINVSAPSDREQKVITMNADGVNKAVWGNGWIVIMSSEGTNSLNAEMEVTEDGDTVPMKLWSAGTARVKNK